MARTDHAETTHTMAANEINRLVRQYRDQRQVAVEAMVKHEDGRAAGVPEAPPPTDHDKAVRQRALALVNGYAATDWALPKDVTRIEELRIEISALDMVVAALEDKWTQQTAVESVEWAQRHGGEWNALCRDILLTATRLQALEAKAAKIKAEQGFWTTLPMAQYLGGPSVIGVNWSSDPANTAIQHALREKLITARDLEAARNV